MSIEYYGNTKTQRERALRRRIIGIFIAVVTVLLGFGIVGVLTDDGAGYQARVSAIEENHQLRQENEDLKAEVQRLTTLIEEKDNYINELTGGEIEPDTEGATPRQ